MMGSVDANTLNWVYNLADFVNKILFGLIIWNLAVKRHSLRILLINLIKPPPKRRVFLLLY